MRSDRFVYPETQHRMRQYLLFRVLITVLGFLLVAFYLSCLSDPIRESTAVYLYSVLSLYLVIGVVSMVSFPRWRRNQAWYREQVMVDFGLQALLVWATGGVVSLFTPVLFVTLAAATGVSSERGASLLATVTTLFLVATTFVYSLGLVPPTSSWSIWIFSDKNTVFVVSYLVASIMGLYAISTLGSRLSKGLRNAEYLQEEIIENMAEGLLAVDRAGRVVHLNGEARKVLGLEGSDELYRKVELGELLTGSDPDARNAPDADARRELLDAFEGGTRRRFELRLVDSGGTTRPVEIKISSVVDDKETLRCRIGLFSDLTLQREVEIAGRRIQKLEELQVMAMGIAHEIRNPLASIRGCVQEIARSSSTKLEKRYSDIVMRESDRLDRIIEEFLSYARASPADLAPVDLIDVIESSLTLLSEREDLGGRTIEWDPPAERVRVLGDPDRLTQVLLNLGLNAIQATPSESGRIRVRLADCEVALVGVAAREGTTVRESSYGWRTTDRGFPRTSCRPSLCRSTRPRTAVAGWGSASSNASSGITTDPSTWQLGMKVGAPCRFVFRLSRRQQRTIARRVG